MSKFKIQIKSKAQMIKTFDIWILEFELINFWRKNSMRGENLWNTKVLCLIWQ